MSNDIDALKARVKQGDAEARWSLGNHYFSKPILAEPEDRRLWQKAATGTERQRSRDTS